MVQLLVQRILDSCPRFQIFVTKEDHFVTRVYEENSNTSISYYKNKIERYGPMIKSVWVSSHLGNLNEDAFLVTFKYI